MTIDWGNKIINVFKTDMIQLQVSPTEIWQLDIPSFKNTLGDLLDDEAGMTYPDIFNHNPSVSVGGAILAKVVEILEPYTITFEDGQYAVNLTGANSNIGDRVNVNQVSVRSANSAGLQDLTSLQAASFGDGAIALDQVNGTEGTIFPIGTKGKPAKTVSDAVAIAKQQNMDKLLVLGNAHFATGDILDGYTITGQNPTKSLIIIDDAASTVGCEIKFATVTGILDGGTVLRECLIYDINYVNGFLVDCVLGAGTITLGGNATALFMRCVSGVPGLLTPIIDMGGSGQSLGIRDYNGGIKIINKTGEEDPFSLDISSGKVILDETVTAGVMVCRGVGKLIDNSTGASTVINEMMNGAELSNMQRLVELQRSSHSSIGSVWYWSPFDGDDTNEGDHISRPVKTFVQAQNLAKNYGHDMIICVANDPAGVTVVDEAIHITKNYLSLRGPGVSFVIKPTTAPDDAIHISADGVAVSGLKASTDVSGMFNGIHIVNATNFSFNEVWIADTSGDGLFIENSNYGRINGGYYQGMGRHGVNIGNASSHIWFNCEGIHGCAEDGIHIEGNSGYGGTSEIKLLGDVDIHYCGGYGVNIISGGKMTRIGSDITIDNCTLGSLNDPNEMIIYEGVVHTENEALIHWESATRTLTSAGANGATAQEVWEYATRTLTEASGLTDAQSTQLNNIFTALTEQRAIIDNIYDSARGGWKVENNQMIFYRHDGTELFRFDLLDDGGNSTSTNVKQMTPVIV